MSDAQKKWNFYPITEDSSGGGDLERAVRGVFTPDVLLSREVIQNSWDAARKLRRLLNDGSIPFRVEFRFKSFRGQAKRDLIKVMGLHELAAQRSAGGSRIKIASGSILDRLDDDSDLKILFVSDFGAHGLYGQPQLLNSESVMFNAIYYMGGSKKRDNDSGTGGSYGFGKAAFIRGSGIRTVFAYTAFQPYPGESNANDPVNKRLVGFCWWNDHKAEGKAFDGRGHFADLKALGGGPTSEAKRVPYEDEGADALAAQLGIPLRDASKPSELGTTLAIVEPTVTPLGLKAAIEMNWWPALEDSLMDIEIFDEEGHSIAVDPSENAGLRPYIQAYRIAKGERPAVLADGEKVISTKWQKRSAARLDPGTCVAIAGTSDAAEDDDYMSEDVPDFLKPDTSAVALMRDPRMVVQYKVFRRFRVPIKGVYVSSAELDALLGDTEPPLHNEWSTAASDDISADATDAASATLRSIARSISEFAAEIAPTPKADARPPSHYASLVSKFLRTPRDKGKGGGRSSVEPISIEYSKSAEPHSTGSLIATTANVDIRLADKAKVDSQEVLVRCFFNILEDESESGGTSWPVRIKPSKKRGAGFVYDKDEGAWRGSINKTRAVTFEIETDPYEPGWTGHLLPTVTPIGANQAAEGEANSD